MVRLHSFISIIIPTRDRPQRLGACLEALRSLNYPDRYYEVVVVDDGSNPPVNETIGIGVSARKNMRFVRNKRSMGASAARNYGVRCARGPLIQLIWSYPSNCLISLEVLMKI